MTFIEQVRDKRKKLADVLVDEEYSGLRELVEELYPDKAHFIYELLQNAEDADANQVEFRLKEDGLVFAHDGRPFSEDDVWGITNIGKGSKREDEDKIGRFGVGFKAVFAYSETPCIWSPTFNFQISDLVLPTEIPPRSANNQATVFKFPFNNPKKSANAAFLETAEGLQSLSEELLIFLQNIKLVKWQIAGADRGGLKRVEHPPHLIEVQKYVDQETIASSCFLRFSNPVAGLPKQNVSLAFPLESKTGSAISPDNYQLADDYRIVPAVPARVSVYFPAEKEVSGLRFHLHAPFVPELSRASIKDTPANDPLFDQLARLACTSLDKIRDLGLLTVDFLNVLPHGNDILPVRYQSIAAAITEAMNNQPLTPTQARSHLPAKRLLQGKATLKDLLPSSDLKQIFQEDDPSDWAAAAQQRNSHADRLLSGLEIQRWDISQFVCLLQKRRSDGRYQELNSRRFRTPEADKEFDRWFESKSPEWLQRLYAMLLRELANSNGLQYLNAVRIIRLADGSFARPDRAFFPGSGFDNDDAFPRVDTAVYSSGKSKSDLMDSRKFLEAVGVREVGELEQVQAVLANHYGSSANREFGQHADDLKRFLKLIYTEPEAIKLFSKYRIILSSSGKWCRASEVYLDSPYIETGLKAFFEAVEVDRVCHSVSGMYSDAGLSDTICEFASAVGARSHLEIAEVSCSENPNVSYLVHQAPGNPSYLQIDQDYWIEHLDNALQSPTIAVARLLWNTFSEKGKTKWTLARYRNNKSQPIREDHSRLACFLRDTPWVPQRVGSFVIPAEADDRQLPEDFQFARGWPWLATIKFGENVAKRTAEYRKKQELAVELGFEDDETLNDAKWFAALGANARKQLMSEYRSRTETELPERSPSNPERRTTKVSQLAADAPQEEKEIRSRSVSTVTPGVKKEIRPYLREQYTNDDGVMICQVCQDALPFKLPNGEPFFETLELAPGTAKVHYQNYIALCPNHAAMFKHANESKEVIRSLVETTETCRLPTVLAGRTYDLYFTKTHLADLRAVLVTDSDPSRGSSASPTCE